MLKQLPGAIAIVTSMSPAFANSRSMGSYAVATSAEIYSQSEAM